MQVPGHQQSSNQQLAQLTRQEQLYQPAAAAAAPPALPSLPALPAHLLYRVPQHLLHLGFHHAQRPALQLPELARVAVGVGVLRVAAHVRDALVQALEQRQELLVVQAELRRVELLEHRLKLVKKLELGTQRVRQRHHRLLLRHQLLAAAGQRLGARADLLVQAQQGVKGAQRGVHLGDDGVYGAEVAAQQVGVLLVPGAGGRRGEVRGGGCRGGVQGPGLCARQAQLGR